MQLEAITSALAVPTVLSEIPAMPTSSTNSTSLPVETTNSTAMEVDSLAPEITIQIGHDHFITTRQINIPCPPRVSFSKDIEKLNRVWDDLSPSWNPAESALIIDGKPVPVKYWRDVYMYRLPGQWKGLKSPWGEWKVCLTHCLSPSLC